jgi:hypothetical protein
MTVTIGRRELLAALGGAAAAWPLAARAQTKRARIGWFIVAPHPYIDGFRSRTCKNQDDSAVEETLGHELLPLAAGDHSSSAAVSPTPAVRACSASTTAR